MLKTESLLRSLALAAVVACGVAIAWAMLVVWCVSLGEQTAASRNAVEQLYVRLDGVPVIVRYSQGSYTSQQTLTLDGQATRGTQGDLLYPQYTYSAAWMNDSRNMVRLASISDGGSPANYWYLYHDGQPNGRAYGVGYGSLSKRIVGYFGRSGFSPDIPPRDDWFAVASPNGLSANTTGATNSEPAHMQGENMHLLADGQLWSIDVRKQTVEPLVPTSGFTVGWAWPTLEDLPPENDEKRMYASGMLQFQRKVVVRSSDNLLLVDPRSGDSKPVPLPRGMRNGSLAIYELTTGGYLLLSNPMWPDEPHHVAWLDAQGAVEKERDVTLSRNVSMVSSPAAVAWTSAIAAPLPLGNWLTIGALAASVRRTSEEQNYAASLADTIAQTWPALLAVLGIGVVSAIAAYRRQRAYGLGNAWAWAVFAFILGVPGYIAYRFHRTWPVLAACPSCGELSPRNREACTECGAAFPPPALKGLEVYA